MVSLAILLIFVIGVIVGSWLGYTCARDRWLATPEGQAYTRDWCRLDLETKKYSRKDALEHIEWNLEDGKDCLILVFEGNNAEYVVMNSNKSEYRGFVYGLYMCTRDPGGALASTSILKNYFYSYRPGLIGFDYGDHIYLMEH